MLINLADISIHFSYVGISLDWLIDLSPTKDELCCRISDGRVSSTLVWSFEFLKRSGDFAMDRVTHDVTSAVRDITG